MATSLYFGDLQPDTPYLDGSGRPLANAKLTFYRSGTTKPITVYSDEGLTTPITTDIVSDSEGVFPAVYLDPMSSYRVKLEDSLGRLVWDVDPYLFPANELAFLSPVYQAREDGAPVPGYELEFEDESTPIAIYADGDLEVRLPNPIKANAGGFFPPIYLTVESPPLLESIDPSSAIVYADGFVMTLTGMNFQDGAVAIWEGTELTTTFVSSTSLLATIPDSLLDQVGSFNIHVENPDGGETNSLTFQVSAPAGDVYFASGLSSVTPLATGAWGATGFYAAATDRTWITWEGVASAASSYQRVSCISVYDHEVGEWLPQNFIASILGLADDDHGRPVIVRDHEGHVHVFHGSHNSEQRHASTAVADDPKTFVQRSSSLGAFAYPHPHSVGSGLLLFMRQFTGGNYVLVVQPTTALSNGVATWGSRITIANPENGDRFYMGATVQDEDDKIHIIATIADTNDTFRRDVYYLIYDASDGSVSNWDGSTVVASANLPLDRSDLDTNFRIVNQGTDNGEIPAFCLDSAGVPHIVYAQAADASGPFTLYHIRVEEGAWTSPVEVGTLPNRGSIPVLVPRPNGELSLYFPEDDDGDWDRGGNIVEREYDGSSWGAPSTILEATDYALEPATAITNADASLRVLMYEQGDDVEEDDDSGPMKLYAWGNAGFVQRGEYDELAHFVQLLMSFDGEDGATSAPDDARGHVMTFSGNAELDTAEKKFGTASLTLDGNGDWIQNTTADEWRLRNLSFCIEGWLKCRIAINEDQRPFASWNTTTQFRGYLCSIDDDLGSWLLRFLVTVSGSTQTILSASVNAIDDQDWHHIAIERAGNTIRLYIDGQIADEDTFTSAIDNSPDGTPFRLGGPGSTESSDRSFNGWLDEWRFTRGWWRYNGAFTPPSAPFPRPGDE